ncbi:MAG: flavin reductase family protein [Panacagrimonas sp.]
MTQPDRTLCRPDDFRSAMQKLAGGVCIVTTRHRGHRLGLTATAVCSLCAEPPALIACVNRGAEAHDAIRASQRICINVLAQHHVELSNVFSSGDRLKGEARFDHGQWTTGDSGAPILEDALADFDCRVSRAIEHGSHSIFICEVLSARCNADGDPLIYGNRSYGSLSALYQTAK